MWIIYSTIFWIQEYIVSILVYLYWIFDIIIYIFNNTWWHISFSKFSDVLPAFTCASAISNLWNICLRVNIIFLCVVFLFDIFDGVVFSRPLSPKIPIRNILLWKALITLFLPFKRNSKFFKKTFFFSSGILLPFTLFYCKIYFVFHQHYLLITFLKNNADNE